MEMIQMYKSNLKDNESPTAMGFLQWQTKTGETSATFNFICQITLNIALSMYIQRVGDRNNDEIVSEAGRLRFVNMFYGFNHPIYREIEYNELRQKVCFPTIISELRKENISFSNPNSNVKNNHEGGDFKLENKIKKIKSLTPKGKKDAEMWRRTIRSKPGISKVIKHGKNLLKLQDLCFSRNVRSEREIVKWRAHLRKSEYLTVKSPDVQSIKWCSS